VSVTEVGVAGWAWSLHGDRPELETVNKSQQLHNSWLTDMAIADMWPWVAVF